jgi:two-component system, LytTR family, response regulator
MNALVVDDEPLARKELRRLLAMVPGWTVVGEATTADEAEALLASLRPDVMLLDIEMPGASGFELLERLDTVPPVIFTTAYDHHAVRAFEVAALDYVVKPIELPRLVEALARVGPRDPGGRVLVRDGVRRHLVPLHEVRLIAAEGNYVRLVWNERELLWARSLAALERQLDPAVFVRANRRELVNLAMIDHVRMRDGQLVVELRGGSTVIISRRQMRRLRAVLALDE